jgi:DNA topoisomerase VI subunit A
MIYKVVQKDKRITQRDLYYNLVTEFKSQNELNEIIQGFKKKNNNSDICSMLECSRESLGLFATSKGFVAGSLQWNVLLNSSINSKGRKRLDQWKRNWNSRYFISYFKKN